MTCDILATESLDSPVTFMGKNTLPGACAICIFDVITTPIKVAIQLRLKSSACIIKY